LNYLVVAASVALFLVGFRFLQVPAVAGAAIGETRAASAVMRDPTVDEEVKETRLQKASLALFGKLLSMILRTVVCFAGSLVPLFLADWAGLVAEADVVPLFYSWEVIAATVIAFVIVWRWR
jgi:hypothetical protein